MLSFSNPHFLWFLILIPVLWLAEYFVSKRKSAQLEKHINKDMIERLYPENTRSFRTLKKDFFILALLFMILGLSGLQIGSGLKELKQEGMDVIVAMDLSTSMSAKDISPSRLERSQYEVKRLISMLKGDRIGLIAFAGVAHLQCPITSDYSTASMMLEMMDTDLLPVQGTAFAEAINTALDAFPKENQQYKAIIFISDGEDHEQNIDKAIQRALDENVLIYTLGVGTLKGATIPIYDKYGNLSDYMRDSQNKVINSVLQENTLRQISNRTGGRYYRLGATKNPIEAIYEHILHGDRQEYQTHEFARYTELYGVFTAIALLFLLLGILIPEEWKKVRR
ncbi:MAG: VWA domain-containing protein [Candidatus Neomarinimicrobiota bacterium]|jgi:Ca-activated chloride channel family protein